MAEAEGGRLYDRIGRGYTSARSADPRIEAHIHEVLGPSRRLLNLGAGAGSYEPTDRVVIAVEPSESMIAQRRGGTSRVTRAVAERLPFADGAFDAAMAVLTAHHWLDPLAGLGELRRVTVGNVVVFTFDKQVHDRTWLIEDYLPAAAALDTEHLTAARIAEALGGGYVQTVRVPHDCVDGFCHAWWRRPSAYLDPTVRAGISAFARLPGEYVDRAMDRLAADLADGTWHRRHGDLLELDNFDAGYRLAVSPPLQVGC